MSPLNLFSRPKRGVPAKPAPQATKLKFECLEDRMMPSVASAAIHAVADNFGGSEVFFINEQNHAFYEHDAAHGTRMLSGANSIKSFSAGIDVNGHADVFAVASDNSFWEYTESNGWRELLGANAVTSFAAVKGGRVYIQDFDKSLWERAASGYWYELMQPGAISDLDAVTDAQGRDAVFMHRTDQTFGELYNGSYTQLAGVIHLVFSNFTVPSVTSYSAGTDLNGNADVFVKTFFGAFDRIAGGTWTYLAPAWTVKDFSATNAGQVWFIASDSTLKKFDAQGTRHDVYNTTFTSISAAASNDVFTVVWDSSLWERAGGGIWSQISGPGTVQQ